MDENGKKLLQEVVNIYVLQKIKKSIDKFLNSHKPSLRGNTITNSEILIELEITEKDYYRAPSISPDKDFHFKRNTKFLFC